MKNWLKNYLYKLKGSSTHSIADIAMTQTKLKENIPDDFDFAKLEETLALAGYSVVNNPKLVDGGIIYFLDNQNKHRLLSYLNVGDDND